MECAASCNVLNSDFGDGSIFAEYVQLDQSQQKVPLEDAKFAKPAATRYERHAECRNQFFNNFSTSALAL
jgi:hypothetical protein